MTTKEKQREYQQRYRKRHKESFSIKRKLYYAEHKEKFLARAKQQREEFREKHPLLLKVVKTKPVGKLTKWGRFSQLNQDDKFISILSKISRIFIRLEAIEQQLKIKTNKKRMGKKSDTAEVENVERKVE